MFHRNKKLLILFSICLFILSFYFSSKVFAVSVSITNFPSSITSDSFTVNVSVLGASSGTNYIRVDLYKDGTQNYFGETYNGSDWYSGSDGKQYFPITIIDSKSTVAASLQARIGIPNSSDYDNQGSYKMRIRRYTSSGGQGSEDPSNSAVSIAINVSTPTPTPTPMPSVTQSPQNSPTSIPASNMVIITPKPSTPVPSIAFDNESSEEAVLGESSESSILNPSSNPLGIQDSKEKEIVLSSRENNIGKILIFLGFVFILACGILFSWSHIRNRLKKDE